MSWDKTDWSLKIKNVENGRFYVISKLDEEGPKAWTSFFHSQHIELGPS